MLLLYRGGPLLCNREYYSLLLLSLFVIVVIIARCRRGVEGFSERSVPSSQPSVRPRDIGNPLTGGERLLSSPPATPVVADRYKDDFLSSSPPLSLPQRSCRGGLLKRAQCSPPSDESFHLPLAPMILIQCGTRVLLQYNMRMRVQTASSRENKLSSPPNRMR